MFKIWSSRPTRNYKMLYSNIGLWIIMQIRSEAAQNFWPDTTPIYVSLTVIKSNNDPTKFNLKKKLTFSYSFCTVKFSTCNRCSSQVTKDFLIIIQKYFALFCKCRLRSGSVFLQRSEQVKNGPDPQHWVNTLLNQRM